MYLPYISPVSPLYLPYTAERPCAVEYPLREAKVHHLHVVGLGLGLGIGLGSGIGLGLG